MSKSKSQVMLINIGRGALLFGAVGGFVGCCVGRLSHHSLMPIADILTHLMLASLIGMLISAPVGAIFGLLPNRKWNPVKKVKCDPQKESR